MDTVKQLGRGRPAIGGWVLLIERRRVLAHTQAVAAERVGVAQQRFSDWESGDNAPSGEYRTKLADYLGITRAELAVEIDKFFCSPVL